MSLARIAKTFCFIFLSLISIQTSAEIQKDPAGKKHNFYLETLFLQPNSDNLIYAVFVSGHQPLHQSWHNQEIKPGFSPAFELGYDYYFDHSDYNLSINWLYLNTFDSTLMPTSGPAPV